MANERRFAVSALSTYRYADAYSEEILLDKYSGEFYVKTNEGDIISQTPLMKEKAHIDRLAVQASSQGVMGTIVKVDLSGCQYVTKAGEYKDIPQGGVLTDVSMRIFHDPKANTDDAKIILTAPEGKNIIVSVDVDCLYLVDDAFITYPGYHDVTDIELEVINNPGTTPVDVSVPKVLHNMGIVKLPDHVMVRDIDHPDFKTTVQNIGITPHRESNYRVILNSILVVIPEFITEENKDVLKAYGNGLTIVGYSDVSFISPQIKISIDRPVDTGTEDVYIRPISYRTDPISVPEPDSSITG